MFSLGKIFKNFATELLTFNDGSLPRALVRSGIGTDHGNGGANPGDASTGNSSGDVSIQAVTGVFSPGTGTLSVFGDALDNTIQLSRNAAGIILVNGGAVAVPGGTPTVANTALIQVFGLGGNDNITLNEANGALPRANLFGGAGNDNLTGGSGGDMLFGQSGNDTLQGKGGFDLLFGGSDNDTLIGGDADDQMFGEGGNDRMIWNPGDDTDLMEGGAGSDTAEVNGGNGAEQFTVTANGTRVRFDRIEPAPFSLDIGTTENLVVNMNGGDDSFSATGNLAPLIKITVDGGGGNDTILGSNGIDLLRGGDGNDFIDGQQGNDVAFLGAGEDVFQWDPGDGSDIVDGGDGLDRMLFNGSAGDEKFEASANGQRVVFTRNLGNIVMDLDGVEQIELNALGGSDEVRVNDLSGTAATSVDINLAGTLGGTTGDGQADTVIVNGTSGEDTVDLHGSGTAVAVVGLAATLGIFNLDAGDELVIQGGGGDDSIKATPLPGNILKLTIDGGAGDDTILGSQGADVLLGGDGNDFIFGDNGDDTASLGAGDDVFQWNPGDGNDKIEGEDGTDRMLFFGANIAENVDITANAGRVLFSRDIANVTMDLNGVETIEFRALGGADNVVVGDLSGTDVTRIELDLRGPNGGGDGAADSVTVNATNGADTFGVTGDAGGIRVFGLQAEVNIFFQEVANDHLTLDALDGDDVIDATSLEADGIQLTMKGGRGDDVFLGSEGSDLFDGGDGDDFASMGDGDDTFVWNPGDDNDTLEGQAGFDTMQFNGANIAEDIDISANGERVTFSRNIANVTMDLNAVERINFRALDGADNVVIDDLSGTDVVEVNVDLALPGGAGDGKADNVVVHGTCGDDVVLISGDAAGTSAIGLAAQMNVTGAETTLDKLHVLTGSGDDVIEASGVAAGAIGLVLDCGAGNDIIIGGAGNDTLIGGEGDDVLIGGGGNDTFDFGPGDDIEIQGFVAGAGTEDRIDLRGLAGASSFDWVMAHAKQVDGDVVFDFGDEHMTVDNTQLAQLHTDDFLLS
jgi:Ca2+-binding RTX toxin-like protein